MTLPLLLRQLRHNALLYGVVAAGLAGVEIVICLIATRLEQVVGLRSLILRILPGPAQALFGAQLELVTFNGAVGFGFQHPAVLVAALGTVVAAGTLPAAEREAGLLDLILAKPLRRSRYVAAVAALMVVAAILFPAALLAGAATGIAIADFPDALPWTRFIGSAAGLSALLLAAGGLVLLFGTTAARRGPAVARSSALLVALYLLEVLGGLWEEIDGLRVLSPFHHFRPIQTAVLGDPLALDLGILLVTAAAAATLAIRLFERQDA